MIYLDTVRRKKGYKQRKIKRLAAILHAEMMSHDPLRISTASSLIFAALDYRLGRTMMPTLLQHERSNWLDIYVLSLLFSFVALFFSIPFSFLPQLSFVRGLYPRTGYF